jgi:hypothetical protein
MTMTVQSAIDLLRGSLATLIETVRELELTVDDVPEDPSEPAIIDALRNWIADLDGDLQGALAHASTRAPATSHAHFNAACRRLRAGLGSPVAMAELQRLAAGRAGAWRRWSGVMQQGVDRCELQTLDAADALLACWRETTDHRKEGDSHGR